MAYEITLKHKEEKENFPRKVNVCENYGPGLIQSTWIADNKEKVLERVNYFLDHCNNGVFIITAETNQKKDE